MRIYTNNIKLCQIIIIIMQFNIFVVICSIDFDKIPLILFLFYSSQLFVVEAELIQQNIAHSR